MKMFTPTATIASALVIAATAFTVAAHASGPSAWSPGFKTLSIECYDGFTYQSPDTSRCESSDFWYTRATTVCKNHCSRTSGKCGVNSFSVSKDCNILSAASKANIRKEERVSRSRQVGTVLFDAGIGSGPYDSMTYLNYDSKATFIPSVNMKITAITPRINYCNGSCGYRLTITDYYGNELATIEEGHGKPSAFKGTLSQSVQFKKGTEYYIKQQVWTTLSVGIFTTGENIPWQKNGTLSELSAASDLSNHDDRGVISFQMKGQIVPGR